MMDARRLFSVAWHARSLGNDDPSLHVDAEARERCGAAICQGFTTVSHRPRGNPSVLPGDAGNGTSAFEWRCHAAPAESTFVGFFGGRFGGRCRQTGEGRNFGPIQTSKIQRLTWWAVVDSNH